MKPFLVEITTYAVVMANDETHAYQVADVYKRDAFGDDANPRIEVDRQVKSADDFAHGWDGECIPYGGDGITRLSALMTPNVADNRTPRADGSEHGAPLPGGPR